MSRSSSTKRGKSRREKIFKLWYKEFGPKCAYCDRQMESIESAISRVTGEALPKNAPTLDHVLPKVRGGNNHMKNLVVACFNCNNKIKDSDLMLPSKTILERWFRAVDKYRAHQKQSPQPDPNHRR